MRYLIILCLCLIGCRDTTRPPGSIASDNYDLKAYVDVKRNVVCYRVFGYEGISCLKMKKVNE